MTVTERAAKYVSMMPPAISGSGGHKATFTVAVALRHGFDLGEEEAWLLFLLYNDRCEPPWGEKELRRKLADAARLTRHPQPRGYLRGANTQPAKPAKPAKSSENGPAKPAKPAKPVRLRAVTWQGRLAEVRGKQETHSKGAPPPVGKPSEPSEDIVEIARRMFGVVAEWDGRDGLDFEDWDRLRVIEEILAIRDSKGRISYTKSQIESCIIGLRPHEHEHPNNAAMMQRLIDAKKKAISATTLAERLGRGHRA